LVRDFEGRLFSYSFNLIGGYCLNSAYRVCMPMSNLPRALFAPEEYRSPQSVGGDLLPSAKLGLCPLHLHNAGKLRTHILFYDLESYLTLLATRGDIFHALSNPFPSMGYPATRVSEGYVLSMGVQLPHRLRVSFHEFTQRLVILLNYLVKIICRSHLLEITSLGLTHPFPRYLAIILLYSSNYR
jgi:hypothetical protein